MLYILCFMISMMFFQQPPQDLFAASAEVSVPAEADGGDDNEDVIVLGSDEEAGEEMEVRTHARTQTSLCLLSGVENSTQVIFQDTRIT